MTWTYRNIAICAPATPLRRACAERVQALAADEFPQLTLHFHEQCFAEDGHFAGPDALRLAALLECANDSAFDAVWFAKGGYGSNRIAHEFLAGSGPAARNKAYLGYSDCGTLLGGLYRAGIGRPVHAPMPVDIKREQGDEAVRRALGWLAGSADGLEPSLAERPAVAFNLFTLAMLVGTDLMPDLTGHQVMIEEVGEYHYSIDRLLFHVTQQLGGVAGLRLGHMSAIPRNDRPFGSEVEEIAAYWCRRSGIRYLGRAEIGHCAANRIVPFGVEVEGQRA